MNRTASGPVWLGLLLAVSSAIGLVAATALTIDKLALLRNPQTATSCDLSPLVSCSKGLESWQGSLLAFPNSILGMVAWGAMLMVSVIVLARVSLPQWLWLGLNTGLGAAFVLVVFLIAQSIYVLGVLCPWCMATWVSTIPVFFGVTAFNFSTWGRRHGIRTAGRIGARWLPTISLGCFVVIALMAQQRLDLLGSL